MQIDMELTEQYRLHNRHSQQTDHHNSNQPRNLTNQIKAHQYTLQREVDVGSGPRVGSGLLERNRSSNYCNSSTVRPFDFEQRLADMLKISLRSKIWY